MLHWTLATTAHSIATGVTMLFGALLVGLVLCLALEEKLHAKKSVIAGVFAIICLLLGSVFGLLPFQKVVVGSLAAIPEKGELDVLVTSRDHADQHLHIEADHPAAIGQPDDKSEDHADDTHTSLHVEGHRISMPVYIPGIDWGVIAIILGSSLFVDVTSKSGLFTWIAIKVTKASRGDPLKLLIFYGIMTVVFSAVLNNVTAMIIVGSLTAVSLEKLNRNSQLLGFLLIEGLLTNVGGLLTLISSVPNIIVGTAADIDFLTFFVKAGPYVVLTTIVTLIMGAKLFGIRRLADEMAQEKAAELVDGFDENDGIESWGFFWFGAAMLLLFIIVIATTSVLPFIRELEMGFVALAFAGIMLIRYKSEADKFYKNIDWDLLGFFMALFVVIYVMEHAGVLTAIGSGLEMVLQDIGSAPASTTDASILLIGAAVFSSVTDNIPLAAMLANILTQLDAPQNSGLWWSVIFGANLGGNLTPIGSASTLVAVTIMHKHAVPMSFFAFVKTSLPYAIVQIVIATIYVLLFLR